MLDRFGKPSPQNGRQPVSLLGEPLLPTCVIFDDADRHIDH
jgi:hypothetical protein